MTIQLLQGDCLELMKTLSDKSIDAIITDPPYGSICCAWDSIIPLEPMWEQLKRVIKPNGAIVLFGAEPFSSLLRCSNIKDFKYDWVWEKSKATGFLNSKKQPLRAHEVISVFYSKPPTYNPQMVEGEPYNKGVRKEQTQNDVYGSFDQVEVKSDGFRFPRSVQYFKTAESEGGFHKTQKPVALMEYLIRTYTNEGETVLDFTAGSGTTGIAALNTNRNAILIERESEYCEIIRRRISEAEKAKQNNLFAGEQ
jgi:site-specific DNA-methyltransferase (adenine-specific)